MLIRHKKKKKMESDLSMKLLFMTQNQSRLSSREVEESKGFGMPRYNTIDGTKKDVESISSGRSSPKKSSIMEKIERVERMIIEDDFE